MSTIIQVKRGSGAPASGILAQYELGWDYTNNSLYIGTTSAPIKLLDAFQNYFSINQTSGALTATGLSNLDGGISVGGLMTVDAATGNTVIAGDLTVNGTQTTINSTTTSITDPIFQLGSSPTTADTYDRGIQFDYGTTASPVTGFFGWDRSTGRFKMIPNASVSSYVYSGTLGDFEVGNIWQPQTNNAYSATGTLVNASDLWNLTYDTFQTASTGIQYDLLQHNGTSFAPTKSISSASGLTIDAGDYTTASTNTIKLKNSNVENTAPTSLVPGELAINYFDGNIYYQNNAGSVAAMKRFDEILDYVDITTTTYDATTTDLTSITYSTGNVVNFAYDVNGNLTTVTYTKTDGITAMFTNTITYDANHNILTTTWAAV